MKYTTLDKREAVIAYLDGKHVEYQDNGTPRYWHPARGFSCFDDREDFRLAEGDDDVLYLLYHSTPAIRRIGERFDRLIAYNDELRAENAALTGAWIPHTGNNMPCKPGRIVTVMLRNGMEDNTPAPAERFRWDTDRQLAGDIIAWKPAPETTQQEQQP